MDEQTATAVPPALELVWGLRERPRRGPKPGLTLDRIVGTAIEIADTEGLGPLSMSRLAERLGFTTMSLYRYVSGKDELLMLMLDAAVGKPPPGADAADWRARLHRWAVANYAALQRHPWVLELPISGPPITPAQLDWFDHALAVLAGTGLDPGEKVAVVMLVSGYVRSEARLAYDLNRAADAGADGSQPSYGALLRRLIDSRRYPALHDVVTTGVFDQPGGYTDADFEYGLQRVLDGIEVLVRQRG